MIPTAKLVQFSLVGSDINGNNQLDYYNLTRNTTQVYSGTTDVNIYSFTTSSSMSKQNFSAFVNDTTGMLSDKFIFYITVGDNTKPNVSKPVIRNSSGGIKYKENSSININFSYIDIDNNIESVEVMFNNKVIGFNNMSYIIPFGYSGFYNVSVNVTDYEGASAYNYTPIFINKNNIAPVIDDVTVVANNTVFYNPNGVIYSFESDDINIRFNATDANNDTIVNWDINITGSNNYNFLTNEKIWNTAYSDTGIWNINLSACDLDGLCGYYNFTINISNNTKPIIDNYQVTDMIGNSKTDFIGGDTLYASFNFSDIENDVNTQTISIDGTSCFSVTNTISCILPDVLSGKHNVTFFVEDLEGLSNSRNITINVTEKNLAPQINNITISNTVTGIDKYANLFNTSNIITRESQDVIISFIANDYNLDELNYSIFIDDSKVSDSSTYMFISNYASTKNYTVKLKVTDGEYINYNTFNLEILDNTKAFVKNISIYNSTNGDYFSESDNISIKLNITDIEKDFDKIVVKLNNTLLENIIKVNNSINITYDIPYKKNGNYTLNITVFDKEGLSNTTLKNVTIHYTESKPTIVPKTLVDVTEVNLTDGCIVNISNISNINFSFVYNDDNGIDEINNFSILIRGENYNNIIYSNKYMFNDSNMSQIGDRYNISFFVNSTDGLYNFFNFSLNNTGMNQPNNFYFNITNTSNGTYFLGGDISNIFFKSSDINNDIVSFLLYSNKTGNFSLEYNSSRNEFNWTIPYDLNGTYKFRAKVVDKHNLSRISLNNISLNISSFDISPEIISPKIDLENLSSGSLIYSYSSGKVKFSFDINDRNGNNTLNYSHLEVKYWNSSNTTKLLNITNENTTNNFEYDWSVPSQYSNILLNLTYMAVDNTNRSSQSNFNIKLVPAEVDIITKTTTSSGGGGGGSRSPSKKIIIKEPIDSRIGIVTPVPIDVDDTDEVIREIVVSNLGNEELSDISLVPIFNADGVNVEIISDTNKTLGVDESMVVRVKIKNDKPVENLNIKFHVTGKSGDSLVTIEDSAILYVNKISSNLEKSVNNYLELYKYTKKLVQDNSECLGLINDVIISKEYYDAGNFTDAKNLIIETRDRCLSKSRKSYENIDFSIDTSSNIVAKVIIWSLELILLLLILPYIIILIFKNRMKKANSFDKKDKEIEKWLKEFYKK